MLNSYRYRTALSLWMFHWYLLHWVYHSVFPTYYLNLAADVLCAWMSAAQRNMQFARWRRHFPIAIERMSIICCWWFEYGCVHHMCMYAVIISSSQPHFLHPFSFIHHKAMCAPLLLPHHWSGVDKWYLRLLMPMRDCMVSFHFIYSTSRYRSRALEWVSDWGKKWWTVELRVN